MYVEPVMGYYLRTEIYSYIFLFFKWHFIFITKKKKMQTVIFTHMLLSRNMIRGCCKAIARDFFFEGWSVYEVTDVPESSQDTRHTLPILSPPRNCVFTLFCHFINKYFLHEK